jgi:hypothetical protein
MAFLQETCLKVLWSDAQSVTIVRQRVGRVFAKCESAISDRDIVVLLAQQQQTEQDEPHQ